MLQAVIVVSTYDLTVEGAYNYEGAHNLGAVKVKAESKDWKTVSSLKPNPGTDDDDLVYAANGENVLVSFDNTDELKLRNVDRFYVVRDDKHAVASGTSELNAWKSYEYQGLNQVVAVENGLWLVLSTLRSTVRLVMKFSSVSSLSTMMVLS